VIFDFLVHTSEVVVPQAIAYVRVSRVGGRSGDSFISPDVQSEAIAALAERLGFGIEETIIELDASGADAARKEWNRAIQLVESGRASAILVYNFSRFSRNQVDAINAIDRIHAAGGGLYSVQEGSFSNDAAGTLLRDTLFRFAQFERDRAREGFQVSQARAIERGIHVASTVLFGYTRDPETRRYEIDPVTAPIVVGMFERRAKGHSWASIARWMTEQGHPSNPQTVVTRVSNRAYLGYAYSGPHENRSAHPPIVSQKLFDEANSVRGTKFRGDGKLTSGMLLLGIVRCHNCGRLLSCVATKSRRRKDGTISSITPGYYCKNAVCDARGYVNAKTLDTWVVGNLFLWLDGIGATNYRVPKEADGADEGQGAKARENLEIAEYDRKKFIGNRELRRLLSDEEAAEELAALTEAVSEARLAVEMSVQKNEFPNVEDIRRLWRTWTNETKREWMGRMTESVTVKPRKAWNRERAKMGWSTQDKYADAAWIVECIHINYSFGIGIGRGNPPGLTRPSDELLRQAVGRLGHGD
jgi:DNA invertase Pin-like site-specific DNA recombinase